LKEGIRGVKGGAADSKRGFLEPLSARRMRKLGRENAGWHESGTTCKPERGSK